MNLDRLDSTWVHVWKEPPQAAGFAYGLIVRAANGGSTRDPDGFDFAANYRAWRARWSGPMIAWTFLYAETDPAQAARVLSDTDAVAYLIDWEDYQQKIASGANLARCVDTLRQLRPGVPIGFTSYPTANQARAHGVAWGTAIKVVDWEAPQVYFASQAKQYDQAMTDAGKAYVQLALSPADWKDWATLAHTHLASGRGVGFWRLGTLTDQHKATIRALTQEHELTRDDVVSAIRQVFQIKTNLAVPQGQSHNDTLATTLVPAAQSAHNDLGELLGLVKGIRDELDEVKQAVVDLQTPPAP